MKQPRARSSDFFDLLIADLALEATQLYRYHRSLTRTQLLEQLQRDRIITPYQKNMLLRGSGKVLRFGDYVVLNLLGRGGTGKIYRAKSPHGQIVAIKTLRTEWLEDHDARHKLIQEANALRHLHHHNIVELRAASPYSETPHLIMELIPGINFQALLALTGTLTEPLACRCLQQMAVALHHIHTQDFIHRDIKPANIMMTDEGDIKLIDFGFAVHKQQDHDHSRDFQGTQGFRDPDLLSSKNTHSQQTDLFALGASLFTLLTGESLTAHPRSMQTELSTALQHYRPDLSAEFRTVLGRVVAPSPLRLPSASALLEELNQLVAHQTPEEPWHNIFAHPKIQQYLAERFLIENTVDQVQWQESPQQQDQAFFDESQETARLGYQELAPSQCLTSTHKQNIQELEGTGLSKHHFGWTLLIIVGLPIVLIMCLVLSAILGKIVGLF